MARTREGCAIEDQPKTKVNRHAKTMTHTTEESAELTGVTGEVEECLAEKTMDVNRYATIKTISQGMLDFALLTANASQLKYVLQLGKESHPYFWLMVSLILISICLQIMVGVCFLFVGSLNINKAKSQRTAHNLNNLIAVKIFLITVINVVISQLTIDPVMSSS